MIYVYDKTLILIFLIICYIVKKVKNCKEEEKEKEEYKPLKKKFKNKYYTIPKKEYIEEKISIKTFNEKPLKTNKIFQE